MNYSDHTQSRPPPCMPPAPYPSRNHGGFWPQSQENKVVVDSQTRFEHAPPFKRPRNYENNGTNHYDNNAANTVPFQPMNPRNSQSNSVPFQPMNPRNIQSNSMGSRGTGNIFFKTRMCARFLAGTCPNGEGCTFAHGAEDLREPPPNWKDIVREKDKELGNWNDDQRIIHREKICRKFYNGEECPYGSSCSFLHESPARFKPDIARAPPRESTAISIGKVGPVMEQRSNIGQAVVNKHFDASTDAFQINVRPWKTRMCSKWESTGQCPFGDRCHFAHGYSELQVSGAHVDSEIMTNAHSFPTKALPPLATETLPTKAEAIPPTQERRVNSELFAKWKVNKKISTIYGDWPEDLIPPECFRH
ncbi:zinc finger CCCH domain-containing protein 39-like [Heracleum sosnowskyi]|uniref:Zinc finger CCCH domain-containing protein 39-like n=1 Tax=Heracleum sosnowskyi TaxID=360622 RepID=A0AAD8JCN9_9APIA|nr:zinc finger CCCH domain-containing protein 39-like [Heracleum sosnowskyi]